MDVVVRRAKVRGREGRGRGGGCIRVCSGTLFTAEGSLCRVIEQVSAAEHASLFEHCSKSFKLAKRCKAFGWEDRELAAQGPSLVL